MNTNTCSLRRNCLGIAEELIAIFRVFTGEDSVIPFGKGLKWLEGDFRHEMIGDLDASLIFALIDV